MHPHAHQLVDLIRYMLERQHRQEQCPDCGQLLDLDQVEAHQATCIMDPSNDQMMPRHVAEQLHVKAQTRAKGYAVR